MLQSKDVDAQIEPYHFLLPDAFPRTSVFIVDTRDLFAALEGDATERRGLERMALLLRLPTKHLHNAGNDAHVRVLLLRLGLTDTAPVHACSNENNGFRESA